jgi:hypothetical protein
MDSTPELRIVRERELTDGSGLIFTPFLTEAAYKV